MQGRTASFSTFIDAQFDEAIFERRTERGPGDLDDLLVLDPQLKASSCLATTPGLSLQPTSLQPSFRPRPPIQLLDYFSTPPKKKKKTQEKKKETPPHGSGTL